MPDAPPPVVIVGAGLAGLACARTLHRAGQPVRVLEQNARIGGRVATDVVEGFRLDHGFQVLLTAYPEAQEMLDYEALDLQPFASGALVRIGERFARVQDPLRHPTRALQTALAPIGTLRDKLGVARLRQRLVSGTLDALFDRPEMTTQEALTRRWGFSDAIVDRFFRPFFGGITLDPTLGASSRTFEFVLRMFSRGVAALPARGMASIPQQLAEGLPAGVITRDSEVVSIEGKRVVLASGEEVGAAAVVIATDAPAARRLHPEAAMNTASVGERCLYFAAPSPPFSDPLLVLNGTGSGPINNLAVLSNVSAAYAPEGQSLISVVVLGSEGEADVEPAVRRQLSDWFGAQAEAWRHLRTFDIRYGLPRQHPPYLTARDLPVAVAPGLFRCGDHLATASINGALRTGRRAAEAVIESLA